MRDWRVTVGGAVTAEAVQEAAEELLRDQAAQIRALRRAVWPPRAGLVPGGWSGPAQESAL
jgi:hypothetical protein